MQSIEAFVIFTLAGFLAWQSMRRRKVESALKEAKVLLDRREKTMQTILNNAPIVFSAVNLQGIFHISEGKGLEKLGRKSNQSVGLSIFEMHNGNPIIVDAVNRALAGEHVSTSFELKGVSYELFMGPELDVTGAIIGASMLSVDITDRKKIEDEKSKLLIREQTAIETSKLKSEFVANMSHEIRTPINGVMGMATLLQDTPLTSQQKEYVDAIKHSGSSLLSVVNDILDFSKIEAGKLDFEQIDFQPLEVLTHTLKNMKLAADEKKIDLITEFSPDLEPWVKGDPGRFRQVITNLIANAVKFTAKGYVRVRVTSDRLKGPQSDRTSIRVEVEDTGLGISETGLKKLFVPFTQAESSMARRFGGTGLGLTISKQLVETMGGKIGASSVEGQGSRFWFVLPLLLGQAPSQARHPAPEPTLHIVAAGEARPHVLVAEDNRVNQIITVEMLKKMGCSVDVVTNGLKAIEALKSTSYDLVLMDCQMPEMDGLEATRLIRLEQLARNRGIPIIAMTANAMSGDREKCIDSGMDDYISKPVDFKELRVVVKRWLQREKA